ncbi:MAG: TolC family protein [Proteobacteria bacterium]|nr:TolC family protein [Pseudomonadota bacterium]
MRGVLMWRSNTWWLLAGATFVVLTQPVLASQSATIDLQQAVSRTLARNPTLMAIGYQIDVEQGRVTQSQLRPNLELGVMVENVLGSGEFDGVDAAETTLSLAWILERGKVEHRVSAARAGVSLVESEIEIRRLDIVAETARLFLASLANQERLIRVQEAVSLAENTVAVVAARVQAARTPDAELARAEAQLASIRLAEEDLEHEFLTSNHQLAAQWGETLPDFKRVAGNVHVLPYPVDFPGLLAKLEDNPDLTRFLTEERLHEARLRLEQANARPDWRVNVGIRRFELSDDQAFVAGITIPLAMRNLNQGRIAQAQANLAKTAADRTATRSQIETQLFALHQGLLHSLHRTTTLREMVLPRMEKALVDTQSAYTAGRYGYFELQIVQQEVLNTRAALVDASIDAHMHVIEIERLTGSAMPTQFAQP